MKNNRRLSTCFFILILVLALNNSKAQCSFENIVPVKVGMSKFDARNQINSTKNFTPAMYSDLFKPEYVKPTYLNGDSVKIEKLMYDVKTNPCFTGKNMQLILSFSDNILYYIELTTEFPETDYNSCYGQYQNIISELDKVFIKFKNKYQATNKDEKVGEGYSYTISSNLKELKESNFTIGRKMNEISVGYKFEERKETYSSATGYTIKGYKKYILEYTHINYFFTKLDGRGIF